MIEIVVADGGSSDESRSLAASFPGVRVVDNPRRIRPAGLNAAIEAAKGDVIVRVDSRTALAPDYVERCVVALERRAQPSSAGKCDTRPMTPAARHRGCDDVAPRVPGRRPSGAREARRRFVDTVYLGAYRAVTIREMGGYDEWSGGNEDAELAWRARDYGGVYLDPSIKSLYFGREGLQALARQFYRYGHNRARTIRKHPGRSRTVSWPSPLFVGLASPSRRKVLTAYVVVIFARGALELIEDPATVPILLASFPTMHAAWGLGFPRGIVKRPGRNYHDSPLGDVPRQQG